MDIQSIQIGDGYQQTDIVLKRIITKVLSIIEAKEDRENFLKINTLQTLSLIQNITQQCVSICDYEESYQLNWSEDVEPVGNIINIISKSKNLKIKDQHITFNISKAPNQIDSMQAYRVPTKQKYVKEQSDKQMNIPAQKIKLSVDINTILTKELQEEKKRLQKEYIEKYSQLNLLLRGSKSPSRDLSNQTTINLNQFKPWELSYAHFNSRQKPFMQIIKQNEDTFQEQEQNQDDKSKFFIRKILSKEAIKRATEKAEKEERERQVIPEENQNLIGKLLKANIQVFRSGQGNDLFSLNGSSQCNGMLEQEEQTLNEDAFPEKSIEFKDFFATQVQQEGLDKASKAYFRAIKAQSPNSVKPFNLKQNLPKATIPQLVDVPLQIIKQKFKKDNIQLLEEKIAKTKNPNQVDEAMLKKIKNIRVRSNSPPNIDRNTQKSPQRGHQIALKDNVKYLINPNLKQEERDSQSVKILPNLDFKQVTKHNFMVSNKLK